MNRPDPNKSRIQQQFRDIFRDTRKPDELEQLKYVGKLLFEDSEINASSNALDRLLRKFCVENHISEEYFAEKFKIYALNELNMHPTQASNNRSNLTKALKAGGITFKRFIEVMCLVLGYAIDEISLEVVNDQGDKQRLAFKEPKKNTNSTVNFNDDGTSVRKV